MNCCNVYFAVAQFLGDCSRVRSMLQDNLGLKKNNKKKQSRQMIIVFTVLYYCAVMSSLLLLLLCICFLKPRTSWEKCSVMLHLRVSCTEVTWSKWNWISLSLYLTENWMWLLLCPWGFDGMNTLDFQCDRVYYFLLLFFLIYLFPPCMNLT